MQLVTGKAPTLSAVTQAVKRFNFFAREILAGKLVLQNPEFLLCDNQYDRCFVARHSTKHETIPKHKGIFYGEGFLFLALCDVNISCRCTPADVYRCLVCAALVVAVVVLVLLFRFVRVMSIFGGPLQPGEPHISLSADVYEWC